MSATSSSKQIGTEKLLVSIIISCGLIICLTVLYQDYRRKIELRTEVDRLEQKIDPLISTDQQKKIGQPLEAEKTPE